LDDGRINGIGTHDELMEQNEIYRDVFNSQQEGMKDQ
jgi:ATP-binding cassette subfamily B protein